MFLTTHYMDEAESCERIAIIDHGELVATGSPEALKEAVGKDRIELHVDDDAEASRSYAKNSVSTRRCRKGWWPFMCRARRSSRRG